MTQTWPGTSRRCWPSDLDGYQDDGDGDDDPAKQDDDMGSTACTVQLLHYLCWLVGWLTMLVHCT